jgi:electron transfer flavoprotein alpha subunit
MILALVEHDGSAPEVASLEALTVARALAARLRAPLEAVVMGDARGAAIDVLGRYGVSAAHLVDDPRLSPYAPAGWAACLSSLVARLAPRAIVAGGTTRGHEVMAAAAARAAAPFAAGCLSVEPGASGDLLLVSRQRWAGSILEDAEVHGSPAFLVVAEHAVQAQPAGTPTTTQVRPAEVTLEDPDLRVRLVERVPSAPGRISLADAPVVVGGGRGVGGPDGFAALEELAALLGGTVGVSRVVTSAGWRPHADQVGQTGTRIAPELYIACGISGAIQHIVGCRSAKAILAINTDPDAPIMAKADFAVIGDLAAVVPAISAEIRRTQASG